MTTFADMTPEQRAECVGVWFDSPLGLGIYLGTDPYYRDHLFVVPGERDLNWSKEMLRAVPRYDLPRAWGPDGTPPEVEQETITTQPHPRGSWNNNPEHPEYFPTPPGTKMRRFVGEWEEA